MGEARRRGTREERIAQAVYRHQQKEMLALARRKEAERAEAERIRNLPPEIRKEVVLRHRSNKSKQLMLAAAALALSMPSMDPKKR